MRDTRLEAELRHEFQEKAAETHRLRLHRAWKEQRENEDRREVVEDAAAEFVDMAFSLATASDVAQFNTKLDRHETATVAALQENTQAIEQVRKHLEPLLEQAHTLQDGRRVFKTRDGLHVYDEFGAQLNQEAVNPHDIEDSKPRWETVAPHLTKLRNLNKEREELLAYQQKLDNARERVAEEAISKSDLDELENDLDQTMPVSIRRHVTDLKPEPSAEVLLSDLQKQDLPEADAGAPSLNFH